MKKFLHLVMLYAVVDMVHNLMPTKYVPPPSYGLGGVMHNRVMQ
jgi:hypothetical protein